MNLILELALAGGGGLVIGACIGIAVAMFERESVQKLVDDTLKDDSKAWDFVRMSGALGVLTYLFGWDVAIIKDPTVIVTHATDFGLGLAAVLAAYAGSVVGHSWAKK